MRSFQWRIAIPFSILIIVSMLALGIYLTNSVRNSRVDNLRFQLEQEAKITAEAALPSLSGQGDSPDVLAKKLGKEIATRITIIAPDGTVLGDSDENPSAMENQAARPEVKDALSSGLGESTRYSTTLNEQTMYVAAPIINREIVLGIARVALPLTAVENSVSHVTRIMIPATIIITLIAILAAWFIARTATRYVRQLTRASKKIAAGQFGQKITVSSRDEIGQFAHAFNDMSANLKTTMETISTEKTKLANVLANMADGVIMTDTEGNIILANPAAGRLFGFKEPGAVGKPLIEVVHDHEADEILKQCLRTGKQQSIQFESVIARRFLRAIAVPLQNQGKVSGTLVLLQDLTELRSLQTMRRDMVGNISHELRTPITGIKVMVETLQNGAIDDKEAAQNFLSRIQGEVDRLTQMVAEITQLSRIESGRAELKIEAVDLNPLIEEIMLEMSPLAEKQQVILLKELAADLPSVQADKDRIRQTIINLVHNGIKFNKPAGKVIISTAYDSNSVTTGITDTGIGISKEDLPHVFERFYKADKARTSGGSGLGLAIAKHTVQAHGGEIRVQSKEGNGATFTFSLPR